jgi:hypothetical protein
MTSMVFVPHSMEPGRRMAVIHASNQAMSLPRLADATRERSMAHQESLKASEFCPYTDCAGLQCQKR